MRKLISLISLVFFATAMTVKADTLGVGITGAVHYIMADGTEQTRQSNENNSGDHNELVAIPEIFVETITDEATLGISYIPTRDMGSESRSDSNSDGDTGTYKAKAELDNVIQIYADIPANQVMGYQAHVKIGIQHATVNTLESLNSGSAYPNQDIWGMTLGYGVSGDLPYGDSLYYKGELTYTRFEDYKAQAAGNKVTADLEDLAAKFSIGKKF